MKQRGFSLIELAIYAVIIGVVTAGIWKAWDSFKKSIAEPYVQAQVLKDQGTIDAFKKDAAEADLRAQHAESDRDKAQKAAADQTAALKTAEEQEQKARDAARTLGVKYAQAMAANAARITKLQSLAGAVPKNGRQCSEVLDATHAILSESQRTVEAMQ